MSNYLDTSNFGQVAGSLLSRKNKMKTRDRNEALIISAILAGINKENLNQQEKLKEALASINTDFKLETSRNKELYENETIKKQRQLYQQYKNVGTREKAVTDKAIEFFNSGYGDSLGQGKSAFSTQYQHYVTTGNEFKKNKLMQELDEFKQQARNYFETLQVPEITTPTFVDYNAKAVAAYKNSLERVKDNPELQGAIRKVFYQIFQKKKDGNKLPIGSIYSDELQKISPSTESENIITNNTADFLRAKELYNIDLTKPRKVSPASGHAQAFYASVDKKRAKRKQSVLNSIDFDYQGDTGTVYDHYKKLSSDEKIAFTNRVLTHSRNFQEADEKTNVQGNVFSVDYYVEQGIREAFSEDIFKDTGTRAQTSSNIIFDDMLEVTDFKIGNTNISVTQGQLYNELLKYKQEGKDEELSQLVKELEEQLTDNKYQLFLDQVLNTFRPEEKSGRNRPRR